MLRPAQSWQSHPFEGEDVHTEAADPHIALKVLVRQDGFWPGQVTYHEADSPIVLAYLVGHEAADHHATFLQQGH